MERLFLAMIVGHFVGDYLLQTRAMALRKSERGRAGAGWCALHCLIYAACVCLFAGRTDPLFAGSVFLSHWPIDRWSLAAKWLRLIRGRDVRQAFLSREPGRDIDLSFACLVYAAADNTMHAVLLWSIANLL